MRVIDIHEHVVPKKTFAPEGGSSLVTGEEMVGIMDKLGIDQAVVLPLTSPETFPHVQSMDEALEVCAKFPERFIPFCNVDPRLVRNDPDFNFVPILEHYKERGCKGVGEITANLRWDDPRVHQVLAGCEQVGFPAIFHVATREFKTYGLIEPEQGLAGLERALRKFPKLQLLGHSQAFWSEVGPVSDEERGRYPKGPVEPGGRVPELMRKYPNLWGDLSAGSGCNALSRDPAWGHAFIEEFQDRLLMGLDCCVPTNDKGPLLAFLREAVEGGRISRQACEKVMGGNAEKLLGL